MITSRRDYLLRMIDEISRLIARIIFKRGRGGDHETLELVVQGYERLFAMERDRLFQFTPEQQFKMLTLDEPPDVARDKAFLYAALSIEAGRTYAKIGHERLAAASYNNALRFTLKAQAFPTDAPYPEFTPDVEKLIGLMGAENIDAENRALLNPGAASEPPSA